MTTVAHSCSDERKGYIIQFYTILFKWKQTSTKNIFRTRFLLANVTFIFNSASGIDQVICGMLKYSADSFRLLEKQAGKLWF